MIDFKDVSKRFTPTGPHPPSSGVEALREMTLHVPAGGVWAVVGPNGAGKSTLLALLLGFLHPSAGEVAIEGLAPRRYVRRHGVAYLPERFRLPDGWRVRSALRALARFEGLDHGEARRRTEAVLERLGLAEHASKSVGALSRGLLQRLGLAQALLAERRLVVLDEPTEGLDPLWRIRFRALVEELRDDGRTVLIASHDLAEMERLAERVVLLEDGALREVLELEAPAEGVTRYRLELAAPAPALDQAFPDALAVEDTEATYLVSAGDPTELSHRLAALLAAGGTVVSVGPAAEQLEERVRRALDEDGRA